MNTNEKTTPSQGEALAWLAGIIDGEGSISCYKTGQGHTIIGIVIVNTDLAILDKIEAIYKDHNIFYSRYDRGKYQHKHSHRSVKDCYEIVVRRRDDTQRLARLVINHLAGDKRARTLKLLEHIYATTRPVATPTKCIVCGKNTSRKAARYCSQTCWHGYAVGDNNPNYRHGSYISPGVTTERAAPAMGEATV